MFLRSVLLSSRFSSSSLKSSFLFICFGSLLWGIEAVRIQKNAVPLSRANAIIASVDDVNAIHYNPAGIGALYFSEAAFQYSRLFDIDGFHSGYLDMAFPLIEGMGIGIGYQFLFFEDPELQIQQHRLDVTLAGRVARGFYLGWNTEILIDVLSLDGEGRDPLADTIMDLGILYRGFYFTRKVPWLYKLLNPLGLGLVFNKLVDTTIDLGDTALYGRNLEVNFGMSYSLFYNLFTSEMDFYKNSFNWGLEGWLTYSMFKRGKKRITGAFGDRMIPLRFGLIVPYETPEDVSVTGGTGFNIGTVSINYGLEWSRSALSHVVSLSYKFGFGSYYIKEVGTEIRDIYISQYRGYSKNSVGYMKVENRSSQSIPVEVSYYVKDFMEQPTVSQGTVPPESDTVVPFYAVFKEDIMKSQNDRTLQAEVELKYQYGKKKVKRKSTKTILMRKRNAMTWSRKKEVAVFVTPEDPVVNRFARNVLRIMEKDILKGLPENFQNAMQIFNALTVYGITYIKDPNALYGQDIRKEVVDTIQFPRETLFKKSGDCDDTTVLYCSLLESVGIETAMVDIPGHVLMMFNTELTPKEAGKITANPKKYCLIDGKVWICVETTLIKDGFMRAWREGMVGYYKWL